MLLLAEARAGQDHRRDQLEALVDEELHVVVGEDRAFGQRLAVHVVGEDHLEIADERRIVVVVREDDWAGFASWALRRIEQMLKGRENLGSHLGLFRLHDLCVLSTLVYLLLAYRI